MTPEKRQQLREAYKHWRPRSDPYQYGGANDFTPIERNVWRDIRSNGLPFYPQYPVGPYFIDFADPVRRIGIEVDGKEYHSSAKDRAKDAQRTKALNAAGWSIMRIPGRFTFTDRAFWEKWCKENSCQTEEGICDYHWEKFLTESSEGILLDTFSSHACR